MTKKRIIIATGGTGGHVFPALSLANYLIKKKFTVEITSDGRGLKYLENHRNLNLIKIPASPFLKKNIFKLIFTSAIIIFSIIKSFIFLLFNRPSVVFGMGGYSSFPVCLAASILRINFIIYENNLIIGKANKYLLPLAKKIFVSYKEVEGLNSIYDNKVVEIGNLVREEIKEFKINTDANNDFDKLKILVLGGSQAAKIFAEELPKIFVECNKSKIPIKVYQQCQKTQNEELSQFYKRENIDYEIFNFIDDINFYYSKVNLVITRSGASVLGELMMAKKPFISIPLPTSADGHQYKNAQFYVKKGCGLLLEEKDIKIKLYPLIKSLFSNRSIIKNILSKQRQYSNKDIFENLIIQIDKVLNETN